jgi:hypothetical protein
MYLSRRNSLAREHYNMMSLIANHPLYTDNALEEDWLRGSVASCDTLRIWHLLLLV